ncbi:bifunctional DNA-formamidopyrimidine glycosylase/DNA-(apurinic or apyrimidinic site) lyase [Falsihalocynthiibacter sp. SS001]|uniref:bifunctional DNA-formamidopyrimidine glycosylase/DNA-(apurinic or apyrimidinic site) lyase n=1 Tax=Falsihalocynthiibacter sp. SS001 TaxID=3349698 RepID=UPI0036D361DA
MPELPEVETVRRGLAPVMEAKRILRADIRRPDLRWPFPPDMAERLTGKQILRLRRRSKYILADLDSGETLIIHLGMSGRMQISGSATGTFPHDLPTPAKHDHVVLDMEGGKRVTFNDARRFGAMDLVATANVEAHKLIAHLGPEPLGNAFNQEYLADRLKNKKTPIKSALLDQGIIAGLGNIYVCEVLFRTQIRPETRSDFLSKDRIERLVPAVREVLSEAIESGGSTLKDHRQADGDLGYFQHSFRVYGREGLPCLTEGCTGTIQRIVQSGRSSFYCAQCQR